MKLQPRALIFSLILLSLSCAVAAADSGFTLNASDTMKEVLTARTGQRTALGLRSGETIDGTISMVGNGLVHVTHIVGKDYFDAVVAIDAISAVTFQARGR